MVEDSHSTAIIAINVNKLNLLIRRVSHIRWKLSVNIIISVPQETSFQAEICLQEVYWGVLSRTIVAENELYEWVVENEGELSWERSWTVIQFQQYPQLNLQGSSKAGMAFQICLKLRQWCWDLIQTHWPERYWVWANTRVT